MFQYEYEKRPPSSTSCDSRATMTTDWSRTYPTVPERMPNARRPLPPRPTVIHRVPDKTTVPLKVWIIASASCFAVCAALVLATVVITKWGTSDNFTTREVFQSPEPIHSPQYPKTTDFASESNESDENAILEKLSIITKIAANREHKNLITKTQIHPLHDDIAHEERKIKKKDKAVIDSVSEDRSLNRQDKEMNEVKSEDAVVEKSEVNETKMKLVEDYVPNFKPILPGLEIPYGPYMDGKDDYYYDENLYDDYMQSNTMTSYLIEKVQELHDWVSTDPDLKTNGTKQNGDFGSLLKALNESLVEGNVTIVMHKLRDIYFGENDTHYNSSRKVIVTNSTDLLSFGILTLDVMLLHNIQLMAWENQNDTHYNSSRKVIVTNSTDLLSFGILTLDVMLLHNIQLMARENQKNHDGDFGSLLKALNESLVEGNVTIVMHKLRDIYFGENDTHYNSSRKVIVTNSTDLLSFGILTLDVMLLHNIQLMARENQNDTHYNSSRKVIVTNSTDLLSFGILTLDVMLLHNIQLMARENQQYLIEKVQEVHEWVSTDPALKTNGTKHDGDFGSLLKALNESLVEGNVTIVMHKLRDIYFGENDTHYNSSRKVIVTNSTDLLSFGILTLDVMLLHNIQLMARENQQYFTEKVQELHDWVSTDPDLKTNGTKQNGDFGSLSKALNESLVEGNVTIVMHKLRDIYFGENDTHYNSSRKVIVTNSTDLLSFGILTLDVMLLHNIQLMAWENQYLIEKVQEVHEWVSTDPDLKTNGTKQNGDFGSLLKALNESLVEGNVTIVMHKLRDIYFGENYTHYNSSRKVIVTNSTDLLSFGILTLDVMLLHNIQLMAWENQEMARTKMMKDPDVFAFNALFLDPGKVETKHNEVAHDGSLFLKRLNPRQDDIDLGKNLLENIMEVGMSAARAAIHLGRAYKNTKNILNQISNKEAQAANIQNQLSRNLDANTHALNHLQTSFDSTHGVVNNGSFYTELDCVWLLYCRNLVATTKLNAPYGTMARINGVALRMLTGELPANKALDTMLYEALVGWTELKCNDMFPRCSKVNAAAVVIDTILQSHRKSPASNRG
ncbi:hypothetical protein PYW07_012726 [Mythimna separata]|uniref:Uncharacterized protein n=1 Tax=Mythimna separata TaxID=271217 RepID=A0AAD7Y8I7_MYTSE|nr:hypothetical protein PYW07_012726 [Mythimna separata]